MEGFELAILFTTAGAFVGASLLKIIVSAGKNAGLIPEHGRGILYVTAVLAAGLIVLALLDADFIRDGLSGQDILTIILAWLGIYTSAVGVHETAAKVQNIVQGTTNPVGPDE